MANRLIRLMNCLMRHEMHIKERIKPSEKIIEECLTANMCSNSGNLTLIINYYYI